MRFPNQLEIETMENAEYHAHPALSASGLRVLKRSPLHYWDRYLNPDRVPTEPTEAMQLGTLIHCAVLEPEQFDVRYIAVPEGIDKRTKEGKQVWSDLLATGREPYKAAVIERVKAIAAAVHDNPLAAELMADSDREVSIFDSQTELKIRPDIMHYPCDAYPYGMIADLKTTTNSSPSEWGRKVTNMDMMIQACFYRHVFFHKFKPVMLPSFYWIVVETESPYAVTVYKPSAEYFTHAFEDMTALLNTYWECRKTGVWPAYSDAIETIDAPAWLTKSNDSIEVSYL